MSDAPVPLLPTISVVTCWPPVDRMAGLETSIVAVSALAGTPDGFQLDAVDQFVVVPTHTSVAARADVHVSRVMLSTSKCFILFFILIVMQKLTVNPEN